MSEAVTPTVEDYLGLIYIMEREGQAVIGARLAGRLRVSRPTVTTTLQRMVRAGLVELNERKEISLTPAGREAAQELLRRHMLAEWLLREVVGLPWHHVHEEAGRLEHHFSEEAVTRMEALFEQPDACPHGNPMPGVVAAPTVALSEIPERGEATVVRIVEEAEEQHELMAFLEETGFLPGVRVRVLSHLPCNETMTVEVGGRPAVLGLAVARYVRVQQET